MIHARPLASVGACAVIVLVTARTQIGCLINSEWRKHLCLRRSLLIGQLHPYNCGGHEESHPPVHLSHEPDRWDGVRYLRV